MRNMYLYKRVNMDYNDEQYINDLVDKYKETGSNECRSELMDSFTPYFKKYIGLFKGSSFVDTKNQDTYRFLRLFMTQKDREISETSTTACSKYIHFLRGIFEDFTVSDMFDELLLYFLEALEKYKPIIANNTPRKGRISFTHYIQVTLRWKMKALVNAKSKDALSSDIVPYSELIFHAAENNSTLEVKEYPPVDLQWVHGFTSSDIFNKLNSLERYILWLRYESDPDGKTLSSQDIANTTGLHKKTIDLKLKVIRKKLKEFI
jgi:hypothetical protein